MYEDVCHVYTCHVYTHVVHVVLHPCLVFGSGVWFKKKNRELNLIYKWTTGMAINSETSPPSFVSFYLQR